MQHPTTASIVPSDAPRATPTFNRPFPAAYAPMLEAGIRTRKATPGDLDALLFLEHHRFQRAQYRYYLGNPQAIVLLALEQDEPVASLLATAGRRSRAHIGRIVSIGVVNRRRRLGLGTSLLKEGLDALRQCGCTRVYLEVAESAGPARSLFAAAGFQPTRRLPDYYGPGIDGIRMMNDFEKSEV